VEEAPAVVPQEEAKQRAPAGVVPGADPDAVAPKPMSKTALKNEKRKQARAATAEKEPEPPVEVEVDPVARFAATMGMVVPPPAPPAKPPVAAVPPMPPPPKPPAEVAPAPAAEPNEVEKKVRALKKKLRGVDDLIAKQKSGTELNADQLGKVAGRGEIVAEIARWEALNDSEELSKEVKKLAKKLRQIEELEERQKGGEVLNADQLGKIEAKEKVTGEHAKLAELLAQLK